MNKIKKDATYHEYSSTLALLLLIFNFTFSRSIPIILAWSESIIFAPTETLVTYISSLLFASLFVFCILFLNLSSFFPPNHIPTDASAIPVKPIWREEKKKKKKMRIIEIKNNRGGIPTPLPNSIIFLS